MDPLLTIGEGSMNPDNLKKTKIKKMLEKYIRDTQQDEVLYTERKQEAGVLMDLWCPQK